MESNNLLFNTGNILSLNELKLKAGQTSEEELVEALKTVLGNSESVASNNKNSSDVINYGGGNRKDLKITVKIFITLPDPVVLKEAIDQIFETLQVENIETLILAYGEAKNVEKELESLQKLWPVLEEFVNNQKLMSAGVSNADTGIFIKLYEWANIKPSILQINLATCCVVPPALQEFTREHDVQLLTHNDSYQILSKESLSELFGSGVSLNWAIKYQVHVKCRGVLSSKGYLVNIKK